MLPWAWPITDEQHRFGINQRALLEQKGDALPDVLVMTATPIPRTLTLTVYGDLDVSMIHQLPPGRKPFVPLSEGRIGENLSTNLCWKKLPRDGRPMWCVL